MQARYEARQRRSWLKSRPGVTAACIVCVCRVLC